MFQRILFCVICAGVFMSQALAANGSLTINASYPSDQEEGFSVNSPLIFEFSDTLADTTTNIKSRIKNCESHTTIASQYSINDNIITVTPPNELYTPHKFCIKFTGIESADGDRSLSNATITFWTGTKAEQEAFDQIQDGDVSADTLEDAGAENVNSDYIDEYNDAIDDIDVILDISQIQSVIDIINQQKGISIFEDLYPDNLDDLTLENLHLLGLDNVYDDFFDLYKEQIIQNKDTIFVNGKLSLSALQNLIDQVNHERALFFIKGLSLNTRDSSEMTFDIFDFAGLDHLYERNLNRYVSAIEAGDPETCSSDTILDDDNNVIVEALQTCIDAINDIVAQEELDRLADSLSYLDSTSKDHRDIIRDNLDSLFDDQGNIIELRLKQLIQNYSDTVLSKYDKGDVNGDGVISIYDALQILRKTANLEANIIDPLLAKLDCDDQVGVLDALRILEYLVGKIDSLTSSCEL